MALQPDGRIILVGETHNGSNFDVAVARYNSDGTLDASFGTGGKVTVYSGSDDQAFAVAIQADGKIIVVGMSRFDFVVLRYNPNGALDQTFGSGGRVVTDFFGSTDSASSVAIQSDARIVAAGRVCDNVGCSFGLARYNLDGTLDSTFGSAGKVATFFSNSDQVHDVRIQSDNRIVVVGRILAVWGLARYNPDGTLDSAFGSGGKITTAFSNTDEFATDMAIQSDGSIVAVGNTGEGPPPNHQPPRDFGIVRYKANGTVDSSFGTAGRVTIDFFGGHDFGQALLIQPDGNILVAGTVITAPPAGAGETSDFGIVRLLAPAVNNTPFGNEIAVKPVDSTSGATPVTLTFREVSQAGNTTLTTSNTGPTPPAGFQLGNPPTYYEVATSAIFSGIIDICINYSGVSFINESQLRLFHFEGGVWVDVTTSLDTANKIICGFVTTLSPFAIFGSSGISVGNVV